jgi:hypothetical protein
MNTISITEQWAETSVGVSSTQQTAIEVAVAPGAGLVGGFPVQISAPGNGDVLAFQGSVWINNPQTNITDGGNF